MAVTTKKTRSFPRAEGKDTLLFLISENVNAVQETVEQVQNLKVEVRQQDSAGNVIQRASAIIVRSPHGMTISIPFLTSSGGGSSGQQVQMFKLAATPDAGDYWNAYTWDGTNLGTTLTQIIKPYKIRAGSKGIASETIYDPPTNANITYNYTYSLAGTNGPYQRTARGSDGSTEVDYISPSPLAGDIIFADLLSFAPLPGNASKWIDKNNDGRAWGAQ